MRDLLQQRAELVAPPLLAIEFGSSLRGLAARGRLTAVEARTCWSAFRDLGVALHFDIAWVERAMDIAPVAALSKVYDATYLACAEALDAELVTCDEKFVAALPAELRSRVRLVGPVEVAPRAEDDRE